MAINNGHSPFSAPEPKKDRTFVRMVIEAAAQGWPLTAMLARIYQETFPTKYSQEVHAWHVAVSAKLQEHEQILASFGTTFLQNGPISADAVIVATWLADNSQNGLPETVELTDKIDDFAHIDRSALGEACYELKHAYLVQVVERVGRGFPLLRAEYQLFWTFDPVVRQTDPIKDAATIGREILKKAELQSMPLLEKEMKWERRRLNPAIAYLMQFVDSRRIRQVTQPDYPTLGFSMNDEDRFKVRRFVSDQDV